MALPPLASVEEFDAWPGVTVGDDETESAEAVLTYVSARVRSIAGRTWTDAAGEELEDVPDVIPGIVVTIAARVWSNPDAQAAKAAGPYSSSWAPGLQGLTITDEERTAITAAATDSGMPHGLAVLRTTRGPVETGWIGPGPWWPEEETIPWPE